VKTVYLATIAQLKRMHRQFLEVVKAELDRLDIRDINNVRRSSCTTSAATR